LSYFGIGRGLAGSSNDEFGNGRGKIVRCLGLIFSIGVLSTLIGCGTVAAPGEPLVDGNRDPALRLPSGPRSGEPNDRFDDAILAVFDASGVARLQGEISDTDDLDVYAIGRLTVGDRLTITVSTLDVATALDSLVAVFDGDQNLFIDDDDSGDGLDPAIQEFVRHDSETYYVVIGRSRLASRSRQTGSYEIDVRVDPGTVAPAPRGQTVYLDFDGGVSVAPEIGVSTVEPFVAEFIDPQYAGQDDLIKGVIVEVVEANFTGFDLTIVTSDDVAEPESSYALVFLGGFFPPGLEAFGAAVGVDRFNKTPSDVAVIFTEVFRPRAFERPPTAEELGEAIGNVTAHEIGHLLGLNHVSDPTALMDAVSPADVLLEDQEFKRSPLFEEEFFPLGYQDAMLLLSEILGLL
jgi:Matrixin